MLGLQIGVSLAVSAGVIVACYTLGTRPVLAVSGGMASFAIALLFTINVAAGPPVVPLGKIPICRILDARVTQPSSCRPRGLKSLPVRIAGSAIVLLSGERLPIVRGRVTSNIETSTTAGNGFAPTVDISGWAASIPERRAAGAILVFSTAGRFVGAVSPTDQRPDVDAAYHDPGLTLSGFTLSFPLRLLAEANARPKFRLFAVAGGVASPMVFHCGGANRQLGC